MTAASSEREFSVAGGTIHAEIAGAGPAVVLLHGWMLDRRLWRAQLAGLAQHFSVVAIDRRGFGLSTAPPGLAREPYDILAIQRQLGAEQIGLVAMSQAGRIALTFAALFPERLRALVLQGIALDGYAQPRPEEQVPIARFAKLAHGGDLSEVRAEWAAHPLMALPPGRRCPVLDAMVTDYDGRDLIADASPLEFAASDLHRVQASTLIISGREETPWRRQVARTLVTQLPRAREIVVAGGHLCSLTHPEAFNRAVQPFMLDPATHLALGQEPVEAGAL